MHLQIPPPTHLPRRLVPSCALPPYRYVPGLHTHPGRSEGNHIGIDKHDIGEQKKWQEDLSWMYGLDLFNYRYYWESHEVWEEPWKILQNDDPYRRFLQGMIKTSASILKRHMGHHRPANLLWSSAQTLLHSETEYFRGINVKKLLADVADFHRSGRWPVITLKI